MYYFCSVVCPHRARRTRKKIIWWIHKKNEDFEEKRMLLEAERNNFIEQMKIQEEATFNIALSCVHSIHYIGEFLTDICNVPSFC